MKCTVRRRKTYFPVGQAIYWPGSNACGYELNGFRETAKIVNVGAGRVSGEYIVLHVQGSSPCKSTTRHRSTEHLYAQCFGVPTFWGVGTMTMPQTQGANYDWNALVSTFSYSIPTFMVPK